MASYLDKTGLSTVIQKLKTKFAPLSHNHNDIYYTETEMNTKLDAKVPTSRKVNGKALSSDITLSASDVGASASGHTHNDIYYTETEMDSKLAGKVDNTESGLNTAINKLSTSSSIPADNDYYIAQYVGGGTTTTSYHRRPVSALWSYIKGKADSTYQAKGNYAAASHTHDDRYYTESEVDSKLNGKVPTSRTVNGKALSSDISLTASDVGASASGHTHSYVPLSGGTITGKINRSGGGSWIKARDNVAISGLSSGQSSGRSFNVVAGQKTDNGYWAIGAISGNDNLVLSYTKDSDYNSGTNVAMSTYVAVPSSTGTVITTSTKDNYTYPAASHTHTKSQITDFAHTHDDRYYTESEVDTKLSGKAASSHKHAAADITSVNASAITGTIAAANLPSYVDDVIEGYLSGGKLYKTRTGTSPNFTYATEISGESGKIYTDLATNKIYRWSGSAFVVVSDTIALGETSSTAYRGDRGKTAYDHAAAKGSAYSSGLYKITTNAQGHVTAATAVQKSDITGLGIPGQDTVYSHPTSSGNKHIPAGGSSGQILRWSADGTAVWGSDYNTWTALKGATTSAAGTAGYAPAPAAGAANRYLRSDGTWSVPPDNNTTYSNMTAATSSAAGKAGLVPAPAAGSQASFLRGDATWAAISKSTVGLGNVENKSSATIRGELTKANVTTALGYTPPTTNTTYSTGSASASGLTKLYTGTGTATDGTMTQNAITTALSGKAASSHTHNYAASSSAGGNATWANGSTYAQYSYNMKPITTAGTGAAYTATVSGLTLVAGAKFVMVPHTVSTTTAPTLNVNSLGAKTIRLRLSSSPNSTIALTSSSFLTASKPVTVVYDGTYWIVEDMVAPNAAGLYGTVAIAHGGTGATTAAQALTNLGAMPKAQTMTTAQFNALSSKDANTLYMVTDDAENGVYVSSSAPVNGGTYVKGDIYVQASSSAISNVYIYI